MALGAKARSRKHVHYDMCGVCKKTSPKRQKNKYNQLVCDKCLKSTL